MIPLESLVLEKQCHYHSEDGQGNHFLDDFQLYEIERASVVYETDSVRRDLGAIFEESHAPGQEYDQNERPACSHFHLLQFQVSVPCYGHEDIGCDQK